MTEYTPLAKYLKTLQDDVRLRFDDIEDIIGASLPRRAKEWPDWWDEEHVQAREGWREAGFRARPDVDAQVVSFVREREEPIVH